MAGNKAENPFACVYFTPDVKAEMKRAPQSIFDGRC